MRIARVFPSKTNMCPMDNDAYFGEPDLFTPQYDEIHISVTFTWDKAKAEGLRKAWESWGRVRIGGPAYDDPGGEFITGRYLRQEATTTSRGCPNHCDFCLVPKREGKIRELNIKAGSIVQDNNLLACSKAHRDRVFDMLKTQHRVHFSGGFESARITDEIVEQLRGLRIYQMWLAYDRPNAEKPLIKAVDKLKRYFKRYKIRCYVLVGYYGDTTEKAEQRLRRAWEIGTLPFAMRYRMPVENKMDTYLFKAREWSLLTRTWTRPAAISSVMNRPGVGKRDRK